MARCVSGLNSCLKVLFNTESPAVLRGVGSNPTLVNSFCFVFFPSFSTDMVVSVQSMVNEHNSGRHLNVLNIRICL